MMKKTIFLLMFVLLVKANYASTDSTDIKGNTKDSTVTIKPSAIYEDCLKMLPGQSLEYFFQASKPVNFNIHYHGDKIYYPVLKDGISSDEGNYSPEIRQYYCLMWTNPHHEPVTLTFRYGVKEK